MAARPHPPRPVQHLFAVALVALAGAVAGCGGESTEERYRKDFQAVDGDLGQLGRTLTEALQKAPGTSNAQLRREFKGYADRLNKIQADLARLDPPARLSREQSALIHAMGDEQRALHGIERLASDKTSFKTARGAVIRLYVSSAKLKQARRRLQRDVKKG